MIDLSLYCAPFEAFLTKSIQEFVEEHPDVEVSCIGFYCIPSSSDGLISFDTTNHSTENVAKWQHKGDAWYGEDEFGRYCNSPADFAFPHYRVFMFEGLQDPDAAYKPGEIEIIQAVTGERYKWDCDEEGDYGLCYAVWNFLLKDLMKNFQGFGQLKRAPIFRLGGRMHDSDIVEFWKC